MYKDQELNIFPIIGEGVYEVSGDGMYKKKMQTNLHITYNLSPIIYDAIKELGLNIDDFGKRLNDRTCLDARQEICLLSNHIKANPDKYRPMEPDNGWGTYDGLVEKLDALRQACKKYPECVIHDRY